MKYSSRKKCLSQSNTPSVKPIPKFLHDIFWKLFKPEKTFTALSNTVLPIS